MHLDDGDLARLGSWAKRAREEEKFRRAREAVVKESRL